MQEGFQTAQTTKASDLKKWTKRAETYHSFHVFIPPWFSKPSTTWMKLATTHTMLWSCECRSAVTPHFRFVRWGTKSESPKPPCDIGGPAMNGARDFHGHFPTKWGALKRTPETQWVGKLFRFWTLNINVAWISSGVFAGCPGAHYRSGASWSLWRGHGSPVKKGSHEKTIGEWGAKKS